MYVGFTGTQNGMSLRQTELVTTFLSIAGAEGVSFFLHGDCIGADAEAHDIAERLCIFTIAFPPADPKKRAFKKAWKIHDTAPYLIRNRHIVEAASIMLACPKGPEQMRGSGTWAAIRYAKRIGRPLVIVYPDGEIERFNITVKII